MGLKGFSVAGTGGRMCEEPEMRDTRTMRALRPIVLAWPLALAPAVGLPEPAAALPVQSTCRITTYYREAAMETVVGVRSTCPGTSNSGRISPYKEVETLTVDNGHGHAGGGSGASLPCEFLAKGCGNLPANRFK